MSLFSSLSQALQKTRQIFGNAVNAKSIEDLESILLQADVGVNSTQFIIGEIQKLKVKSQNYKEALSDTLKNILNVPNSQTANPQPLNPKPQIIMIVGVPGSGKTTTIAKLANFWQEQGKKVIISASDTYRAAAASQLSIWAKRVGVEIVFSEKGQDAGAIAFDAIQKAQSGNFDIVLIDTAGRLHTRKDLMEEAKKIKRVCQKFRADAPDEIWLILDATIGQNSIEQAKTFNQELKVTGAIITKLDGTAKGGGVIPIVRELGIPIRFLGLGERAEDIEEFNAEKFIQALLNNS